MHFLSSVKEWLIVLKVPLLMLAVFLLIPFLNSFFSLPAYLALLYSILPVGIFLSAGAFSYRKTGRVFDGIFSSFLFGLSAPFLIGRLYLDYLHVHFFAGAYLVSIMVSVFLGALGAWVMEARMNEGSKA
ncbi:MAG: hypothetical protein HY917_02485 [Candidatus Diapherotrites archaeon]|nr:hypothetical protein [Candidatus Diapherotrites archaeon]